MESACSKYGAKMTGRESVMEQTGYNEEFSSRSASVLIFMLFLLMWFRIVLCLDFCESRASCETGSDCETKVKRNRWLCFGMDLKLNWMFSSILWRGNWDGRRCVDICLRRGYEKFWCNFTLFHLLFIILTQIKMEPPIDSSLQIIRHIENFHSDLKSLVTHQHFPYFIPGIGFTINDQNWNIPAVFTAFYSPYQQISTHHLIILPTW